jgi:hypothetical protein
LALGWLRGAVLGSLILLAAACGRSTSVPDEHLPERITAEWLRQQPGSRHGDVSFHLLDADGQPLGWSGLSVEAHEGAYSVVATAEPPVDTYLYVTYPSAAQAFDYAELAPDRSADFLLLAVPGRITDVLPLGLVRVAASRNRSLPAGPLLTLRLAPGREQDFRSASAVIDDPLTAPTLILDRASPPGQVDLRWLERNRGDYNNNGFVEIADLTPLGAALDQVATGNPDLDVIDGNGDGLLTINDLAPIGRNFGRQIQGYVVERAVQDAAPADADFSPVQVPTVRRSDVVAGLPPAERKRRLQYMYSLPHTGTAANHFRVRAWSGDGGTSTFGPVSNVVTRAPVNVDGPPVWPAGSLTSVTGILEGLRAVFRQAVDPEGGAVSYVLRYVPAGGDIEGSQATAVALPPAVTAGAPPYTYDITGLTPGQRYDVRVEASDPLAQRSVNNATLTGKVPTAGLSGDPWSHVGGNSARTHSLASANFETPLAVAWSLPAYDGAGNTDMYPVVSATGRVYVGPGHSGSNTVKVFDLTGTALTPLPGASTMHAVAGLDGDRLIYTSDTGLVRYDLDAGLLPTTMSCCWATSW